MEILRTTSTSLSFIPLTISSVRTVRPRAAQGSQLCCRSESVNAALGELATKDLVMKVEEAQNDLRALVAFPQDFPSCWATILQTELQRKLLRMFAQV